MASADYGVVNLPCEEHHGKRRLRCGEPADIIILNNIWWRRKSHTAHFHNSINFRHLITTEIVHNNTSHRE